MGRELLGRISLVLLGLLVAGSLMEVLARLAPGLLLTGAVRSPAELERLEAAEHRAFRERAGRWRAYGAISGTRIWRVGAVGTHYTKLGLDHSAEVAYNRLGLRDRDPAEVVGRPVVLLLGDSFIEARQVPASQTAARLLEGLLQPRSRGSRVVNAGIGGTGTTNQLHLLEHLLPIYRPQRVVLVFFAGNDFVNNTLPLESLVQASQDALQNALEPHDEIERPGERRTQRPYYRVEADGRRRFVPAGTRLASALAPDELVDFEAAVREQREAVAACVTGLAPWRRFEAAGSWLAPDLLSLLGRRLALDPTLRCTGTLQGVPLPLWMESATARDRYPVWWKEAWEVTIFLLSGVRDLSERAGASFDLVILPDIADADPAARRRLLHSCGLEGIAAPGEPPAAKLLRRLTAEGIRAVDLTPALAAHPRPASLYLPLDPHLNADGQRWLAERLADVLRVGA